MQGKWRASVCGWYGGRDEEIDCFWNAHKKDMFDHFSWRFCRDDFFCMCGDSESIISEMESKQTRMFINPQVLSQILCGYCRLFVNSIQGENSDRRLLTTATRMFMKLDLSKSLWKEKQIKQLKVENSFWNVFFLLKSKENWEEWGRTKEQKKITKHLNYKSS